MRVIRESEISLQLHLAGALQLAGKILHQSKVMRSIIDN